MGLCALALTVGAVLFLVGLHHLYWSILLIALLSSYASLTLSFVVCVCRKNERCSYCQSGRSNRGLLCGLYEADAKGQRTQLLGQGTVESSAILAAIFFRN